MNEKTLYAIGGSILVLSLGYFGYKLSVAQKQKEKALWEVIILLPTTRKLILNLGIKMILII